jgi:exodeoxyribonuclease-3
MKVATFNLNNVNKRLPNLLRYSKATYRDFPVRAVEKARYGANWRAQKT